jgi:DNA-binding GntR family transcriptional regulator
LTYAAWPDCIQSLRDEGGLGDRLSVSAGIGSTAPSRPKADYLADRLREEIVDGRRRPGERIRQEAVASQFGTSRIPVREALRKLASEGLMTIEPHVGARVARLDVVELDEIYLLRERVEPMAIAQSAAALTDDQLQAVHRAAVAMEAVADPNDLREWLQLDRDFHFATYAAAVMPRTLDLIRSFWNATQQYRRLYTQLPNRLAIAHAEHDLLFDALKRRDPEDAERILVTHIRRTRLTLEDHMELFGEV